MNKLVQVDSSGSNICFKAKNGTEYIVNTVNIHLKHEDESYFVVFSHGGVLSAEIDADTYKELKEILMS